MYLAIMFCQAVSGPHALSFNTLWGEKILLRSEILFRGFKRVWLLGKQGLSLLICSIQVQSVSLGVELAS